MMKGFVDDIFDDNFGDPKPCPLSCVETGLLYVESRLIF